MSNKNDCFAGMSNKNDETACEMASLNAIPGSAEDQKESRPKEEHYRRLAIFSIIFGCSCFGYKALENSFKAQYEDKSNAQYSQNAKKYSILAFVTLIGFIIGIPLLLILVSYLLTLKD